MSKLLYGVGSTDGLKCRLDGSRMTPMYTLWSNMLSRCYGAKTQSRQPTYQGCEVSDNFKSFNFFTEWCQEQVGFGMDGYALDKDLLMGGNKVYSEDTCVFLPRLVNQALITQKNKQSNIPSGVHRRKGCKINIYQSVLSKFNVLHVLCRSDSIEECFFVYKKEKELYLKELADMFKDDIDIRAYNALVNYQVNKGI